MKKSGKIWSSISILTGTVIAVLALVRGPWQHRLLVGIIGVWFLCVALTVLIPQAKAAKQQRAAYQRQYTPPAAPMQQTVPAQQPSGSSANAVLLRHVNFRISAYLQAVYPNARWEWREDHPEQIILQGGIGRIRVQGIPEYNYADIGLDTQGNLSCSLVKIVPLSDKNTGDSTPPNEQAVDPQIWFEMQGRKVLQTLIADLRSRGHSSLKLAEDGSIHVEGEDSTAYRPLPSFPEKVYWPQLVKVLEREGYAADPGEDAVKVTW